MRIRFENPGAKIITGNTECGIETNLAGRLYPNLISPVNIPELRDISVSETGIEIGASATLSQIDQFLRSWVIKEKNNSRTQVANSISEILNLFGGDQIRVA